MDEDLLKVWIKDLPEKDPLEVKDTDILIIEDEEETHQISVSSLRTALLGVEKIEDIADAIRKEFLTRIEECESLYPFKIVNAFVPIVSNTVENMSINQNNVDFVFKKKSMRDYEITITEMETSPGLVEYDLNGMTGLPRKWVAVILDFNINTSFVSYDDENASGEWAAGYELDNTNPVYVYSAKNDLGIYFQLDQNRLMLWVDMADLQQTFAFKDSAGNIIRVLFKFKLQPEKEEPEPPKTYTVYVPEDEEDVDITVTDNSGIRVFNMIYNKDIPYTLKDETNELPQSGNWVKLKITPPTGHALPTSLIIDGEEVTTENLTDTVDTNGEEERNPDEYDYCVIPHGKTEENPYYIDFFLRYVRDNQIHSCIFTWGTDYTDTLLVAVNKIVFPEPPIEPEPGDSGTEIGG